MAKATEAKSLIPTVEVEKAKDSGLDPCPVPSDDKFTDGIYYLDGVPFALCVHENDGYGRTHTLKNSASLWEGTAEQFNATFTHK